MGPCEGCIRSWESKRNDVKGEWHHITLYYITLHYITLHYITLHYITLHYITLHYITLHYITLYYITLHYHGILQPALYIFVFYIWQGISLTRKGIVPPLQ